MPEQWAKWEPISGLSAKYYIDSISQDRGGFKIILSSDTNIQEKVHVIFADSVWSHRSTDESFRQNTLYTIDKAYGQDLYVHWTFFKIKNSTYLQWLSEESFGITDNLSLIHFCLYGMDDVIDIAAAYEPHVELIIDP